jgi:outer membrane protein
MSVNSAPYLRALNFRVVLFAVFTLLLPGSAARALDVSAPFTDPLSTLPEIIRTGVTLPGDAAPFPCSEDKDFSTSLTLAEAVDIALCNNPQVKAAWASIKIQASELGQARASYLPSASITTNRLQTSTKYPRQNGQDTVATGDAIAATFSWRIFDFGGREANRQSANQLLIAAISSHDAVLQKTLSNLVQAYFDAQSAQSELRTKMKNLEISDGILASARRREERGLGSRTETLQAATLHAKAALERGRAVGTNQRAQAILAYALGVSIKTPITLSEDLRDDKEIEILRLDDWLTIATESHPSIKAARAQWEAAKYKIASARSEGLPTFDFSASYNENGYPGQGLSAVKTQVTTIGISMTIPVFDGFSRTYKIRGAESLADQRRAELDDIENNVLSEIVKAHADTLASILNLQAADNLLNAAQESMNGAQRKFEKGAADISEILNTQTALLDAQQEHVRSLAEWRSARLRLLAGAGVLGRTFLHTTKYQREKISSYQ